MAEGGTRSAARRNVVTLRQALAECPWLSERYLRRLVYERRIRYSKVGGKLLFDLADLDRIVNEGVVDPRPQLIVDGSMKRRSHGE